MYRQLAYYNLFTYFGSSNFFWFLLHNESLWRICFVQIMCCTSTFWKCVWLENVGSITKSYERESKKCHLEVLSIFTFGIVGWRVGRIAADFSPRLLKNRFLQPVCLLCIVTQLVEILVCLLPCSGVADKWPLSRSFYAGPAEWRENNGVKMTSWSC